MPPSPPATRIPQRRSEPTTFFFSWRPLRSGVSARKKQVDGRKKTGTPRLPKEASCGAAHQRRLNITPLTICVNNKEGHLASTKSRSCVEEYNFEGIAVNLLAAMPAR